MPAKLLAQQGVILANIVSMMLPPEEPDGNCHLSVIDHRMGAGDATGEPLYAVTVCIDYSDYLNAVLANRAHFDRWIIVTIAEDENTRVFCEDHGLECVLVNTDTGSEKFDAWKNKAAFINAGLDALPRNGWVVLVDADTLLPSIFGHFVRKTAKDPRQIFGTYRRRYALTEPQYRALSTREPWDLNADELAFFAGFLQVFALHGPNNRYPKRPEGFDRGDDVLFLNQFPTEDQVSLPFCVLHVGRNGANWNKRNTPSFSSTQPATSVAIEGADQTDVLSSLSCGREKLLVVGCYPDSGLADIAQHFSKVYLLDLFGVLEPGATIHVETYRRILREKLAAEMSVCSSDIEYLSVSDVPEKLPSNIDLCYFPYDIGWLQFKLTASEVIQRSEREAFFAGTGYNLTASPDVTSSVLALLGLPTHILPNGNWHARVAKASFFREPTLAFGACGVAVPYSSSEQFDILAITLHSIRNYWDGALSVFVWGTLTQALYLLQKEYNVTVVQVSTAKGEAIDVNGRVEYIARAEPFQNTIVIAPGCAVIAPLETAFRLPTPVVIRGIGGERIEAGVSYAITSTFADFYSNDECVLLMFLGDPAGWTDDAWAIWCEFESAVRMKLSQPVRIENKAIIATVLSDSTINSFERTVQTWKFSRDVEIWVVANEEMDLWLPHSAHTVRIFRQESEIVKALHVGGSDSGQRPEHIVLIPPNVMASLGAELRVSDVRDTSNVVSYGAWLFEVPANPSEQSIENLLAGIRTMRAEEIENSALATKLELGAGWILLN